MKSNEVLLIDDDINNRILLEKLMRSKGISIEAIDGYEKAKDILNEYIPKVLIIDYYLPGKTGIEIIAEFKAKYDLSGCQIIISTAKSIEGRERAECEKKYNCIILDKLADKNKLLQVIEDKIKGD